MDPGSGGPWFEDLKVGQVFDDAPGLTLTDGHAAFAQAVTGDRLRLALDAALCAAVTGSAARLAHPMLVCNVAIGQSTIPSQRVRGNLFYRRLVLQRPVFLGDTLRTRTEVVALKQNRAHPDKPATGLAVLRVTTRDQDDRVVLDFWRCPMIPLRDPGISTGHGDDVGAIPEAIADAELDAVVPPFDLDRFRLEVPDPHRAGLTAGDTLEGPWDTVTAAPELVRMTLNLAALHVDDAASPYGKRLVYGGHTIAIAAAHVTRALPALVTMLAWRSCDHTGPVFEGDRLRTDVTVEAMRRTAGGHVLVDLRAVVHAARDGGGGPVLDWRSVWLMA